jgi:hypothetical protein
VIAARAIEIGLHRGGVDGRAVMEGGTLAQLHGQHGAVLVPIPLGCDLRHDLEPLADVDQLVAERGEDDAPDEGARPVRVEHVRVFLEADAEFLGDGPGRRQDCAGKQRCKKCFHVSSPHFFDIAWKVPRHIGAR